MPDIMDLCRYTLAVTNLEPGTYNVMVDGVHSATVSSTQLAKGWNMATMTNGPIYAQLQEVLGRIRDKLGVHRTGLTNVRPWTGCANFNSAARNRFGEPLLLSGEALVTSLAPVVESINQLDIRIREAAQPLPRRFVIQRKESLLPPGAPSDIRKVPTPP
jgi:hypothetical protein